MGDKVLELAETPAITSVKSYRDLLVWQESMGLVTRIYAITRLFPKEELYGLTGQIRRACVSVPSNIAEGHARDYLKEYLQFLSISLGSLAETQTLLTIARQLNYLPEADFADLIALTDRNFKMIKNLQKSLKQKLSS